MDTSRRSSIVQGCRKLYATISLGDYEQAMRLSDEAYDILVQLFGDDDTDTLHSMSLKVKILFGMKLFDEALKLSKITIEKLNRFYNEVHFSRYEQLLIRLKCLIEMNHNNEEKELSDYVVNLAKKSLHPELSN